MFRPFCRLFVRFAQGIGREYKITKFTRRERTSLQSLNNRWVCEYLLFPSLFLSLSITSCRNKSPVWSTGLFSDCLEKNEHAFKWANNAKIYDNWSRVECPHSRENKLLKHCIYFNSLSLKHITFYYNITIIQYIVSNGSIKKGPSCWTVKVFSLFERINWQIIDTQLVDTLETELVLSGC